MTNEAYEHDLLPETTCTGDDCTGRGPKHREHPKFPCGCGMWYATARGRSQHLGLAAYSDRAAARARIERQEAEAALPELQQMAQPHGLTVSLTPRGCRLDLQAPDGRFIASNWCAGSIEYFIQEYVDAQATKATR